MHPVLLIDFGSTYTKVTAVDIETASILGTSAAYTTVETDINEGFQRAMEILESKIGKVEYVEKLACSSAAGGLRMVASGLVPTLTEKAARLACFGAGAKVLKSYAYGLTHEDITEIDELKPDIFLLAGGTDGGNGKNILHNAKMLATCKRYFPILLAGNRNVAAECEEILCGREVYRCENVMPAFEKLNIEPVQERIREIFLKEIMKAKGLSQVTELISDIMMPTPSAMLTAMELLASEGIGELLAVDLGGATTDVYSMAKGLPKKENVIIKGLQEPFGKRTVEGDIGMRYSVNGIADAIGLNRISEMTGLDEEEIAEKIDFLNKNPETLSETKEMKKLEKALACLAVETAVNRHVGFMEEVYTPIGRAYAQSGKDLTEVKNLILTGGIIIHDSQPEDFIQHALYNKLTPNLLKPREVRVYIDQTYILAAMGLLSKKYPTVALNIMKKELKEYEITK